jgi:hypothetical protein
MIKSKLRKIAIVFSSLAVLSGGFGIDTAYARDGGFPYERFGFDNSNIVPVAQIFPPGNEWNYVNSPLDIGPTMQHWPSRPLSGYDITIDANAPRLAVGPHRTNHAHGAGTLARSRHHAGRQI